MFSFLSAVLLTIIPYTILIEPPQNPIEKQVIETLQENTIFDEFNIKINNKTDLDDSIFQEKKETVKKVLIPFLLFLKDKESFRNLEINFINYKDKVRGQFAVHTISKREIRLNKNLDHIMIATTLVHEIWHQLTYLLPQSEQNKFFRGCFINNYAKTNRREDIAESFTYFMNANKQDECFEEKIESFYALFEDDFVEYLKDKKENNDYTFFQEYEDNIATPNFYYSSYLHGVEWMKLYTINKIFNIEKFL